ncbi:MAG: protein kinase [Acidobacteriota bacterium]
MSSAPTQLGPYRIEAPIGAGGMGQVFRATDTRLHRTVAIKILPHDKVADAERKQRFLQEARAASALNHPNIVALYDIAKDAGVDYLVMEYVKGEALNKLIPRTGLPLPEVAGYAVQIADALTEAHAAGIVHRDIKPANVMVTSKGQVKVLDFGLAKLEEPSIGPEDETQTLVDPLTNAGVVMGTLAYMSPEQARGERVDARTDLFSFGAVLYEMATGRRPFLKPLDWGTLQVDALPLELKAIVGKLLQVERDKRYQTASDVAADLRRLQPTAVAPASARLWWMAAVAALLIAGIGTAALLYVRPKPPAGRDQWVQLTSFPDSVSQPALSPDGRMLVFVRGPDTFSAPGQIYIKMLPDGEPVQVTRDELNKMSPMFSPEGARIAYTVTKSGKWDTWVAPVLSKEPRLWLVNASGLAWLDKQRILFSEVKDAGIHMAVVTSDETRAGQRDIYVPASDRGMAHRTYPSPDGKNALLVEMDRGAWLPCRLVPLDSGAADRAVGPAGSRCTFGAWSPDGKWMYFSAAVGERFHTWRQRYPDGVPEQITSGPSEEEGIAMAADGLSMITAVAMEQSVVWIHDSSGERQVSLEGYSYDPRFTPDGKRLCYRILKGALPAFDASELRIVDLDTGHNEPLLPGLTIAGRPGMAYSVSLDGKQVVAAVKDQAGKPRLWIAALDRQAPPWQVPAVEGDMPHFGEAGEIFFRSADGYVDVVRADGTGLRRVSDQAVVGIYGLSLDSRSVMTILRPGSDGARRMFAMPTDGGPLVPMPGAGEFTWSADGTRLFVGEAIGPNASNLLGRTYVLTLPPGRMFPANFSAARGDLAKAPGVKVLDAYDTAPGPSPDVYAFSRGTVQRNLYRIPLP